MVFLLGRLLVTGSKGSSIGSLVTQKGDGPDVESTTKVPATVLEHCKEGTLVLQSKTTSLIQISLGGTAVAQKSADSVSAATVLRSRQGVKDSTVLILDNSLKLLCHPDELYVKT